MCMQPYLTRFAVSDILSSSSKERASWPIRATGNKRRFGVDMIRSLVDISMPALVDLDTFSKNVIKIILCGETLLNAVISNWRSLTEHKKQTFKQFDLHRSCRLWRHSHRHSRPTLLAKLFGKKSLDCVIKQKLITHISSPAVFVFCACINQRQTAT